MNTKIKILFFICSVLLTTSCTDKAKKFLGTWQNLADTTITITITKSGDNFVFEGEDLKKNIAIYNKEHDKLEVNIANNGENSDNKLNFIYIEETKHLLGDRGEYKKQDWTDTSANKFGRFKDPRDGKVYKTIKIGTQIWMAENLAFKTSTGCRVYGNNNFYISVYGYLYSWESAKNVCPSGWHLPTDAEWTALIAYLGGEDVAGGKLKSTSNWASPNKGATNSSGFAALPGGMHGDTDFGPVCEYWGVGEYGIWWGSDGSGNKFPCVRFLQNDESIVGYSGGTGLGGGIYCSIRCIMD